MIGMGLILFKRFEIDWFYCFFFAGKIITDLNWYNGEVFIHTCCRVALTCVMHVSGRDEWWQNALTAVSLLRNSVRVTAPRSWFALTTRCKTSVMWKKCVYKHAWMIFKCELCDFCWMNELCDCILNMNNCLNFGCAVGVNYLGCILVCLVKRTMNNAGRNRNSLQISYNFMIVKNLNFILEFPK